MDDKPEAIGRCVNNCHDPEIVGLAKKIGVRDERLLNEALSKGETTAYGDGVETAVGFLIEEIEHRKPPKTPKTGLSKSEKRKIMARHGLDI